MMPLGSEIVPSSRQTYPVQSPQTLQENVPTPPSGLVFTDVDTQTSTAVIRSTSDMKLRSCSCKVKVKCQKCLDEKLKFQHFTLRPGWIFWLWSQSWGRRFCWSWRSQSPDCFYWKWFWMINEHANMQEARLLSFILYSESVIPFPVYVQFDLQEHFHPPHISSSSSSSMRGFCPPQCVSGHM